MSCCLRKTSNDRHLEGCPNSNRRKDFFRKKERPKTTAVAMTCLDCRGYRLAKDEGEMVGATCPRCGGSRMIRSSPKNSKTYVE